MVVAGMLVCQTERIEPSLWPQRWTWGMSLCGVGLLLYVFMAGAIGVLPEGLEAARAVRPAWFNWPLFLLALPAVAAPFIDLAGQLRSRQIRATGV
jgi:hypothetical protein